MMFNPETWAVCALFAAFALPAQATDVALVTSSGQSGYGSWQQFNVSDLDSLTFGTEWIDFSSAPGAGFGTPLTFTFTIAAGQFGRFTAVDAAFGGDTFKVTDFGNLIGATSAVPITDYATAPDVGLDFDAALANPAFSQGLFLLGAGSHRISGRLDQSVRLDGVALNATVGAVRLTVAPVAPAVPEPSTGALLLAGLGAVGALVRRRRRQRAPTPNEPAVRTKSLARATPFTTSFATLSIAPFATALAAGLLCLASAKAQAQPRPPIVVKLIAFNDYHGNLQSPGSFGVNTTIPAAQRPPVGGAEYLAAYVARMKAQNPLNVVVGGGDFIGASPLISALFFDEPAVETLNHIGVEFSAVGNHEFDKGSAELRRLQNGGCKLTNGAPDPNSCKGLGSGAPGTFDGAKFKWLSANVIETATGRSLLPAYGIKSFDGVKVAFIGMTLKDTPRIVTPTGVAGLEFRDEADTVNALVPRLRAQGIEAIVVLVHQGGFQTAPNVGDINGCDGDLKNANGSDSDIGAIVKRLDNAVDLVISAHTHAAYNCSASTVDVKLVNGVVVSTPRPTGLANRAGRLIPVTSTSAFGRLLTDIDLSIDPVTRNVAQVSVANRLVDRTDAAINAAIAADPGVKNIVAGYDALVSPIANQVIGTITTALPNSANSAGEQPAGDLIADAQLQATQPVPLGGAVAAFMNPGGIRSPGFIAASFPHDVTYGEAFTVQPFGNSLVTMTLTAQQIRNLLEQQFVGCLGQATQRILQVSNGLKYTWSAAGAPCAKVSELTLTPTDVIAVPPVAVGAAETLVSAGVVLNPGKTYRVTVNNFLATGGDGFTVLLGGQNLLGGAQDIDALVAYLAGGYKAPKAAYDPASPAFNLPRVTRLP